MAVHTYTHWNRDVICYNIGKQIVDFAPPSNIQGDINILYWFVGFWVLSEFCGM